MRTTMSRAAIDAARWRGRRPETLVDELPAGGDPRRAVPDASVAVDDRESLWPVLASLAPRQRAVLVLRYYEDLSEAEIARTLGCSRGTVKAQASRGLAALRAALDEPARTASTAHPVEQEAQ